jgi:hypothetical protein
VTIDVNRAETSRRARMGSDQALALVVCLLAVLGVAALFLAGA